MMAIPSGVRPVPKWFSIPERIENDFRAINMAAEIRVERDPSLTMAEAVRAVIDDCLRMNENWAHRPTGAFLDWNWYRVDAMKAARGIPHPQAMSLDDLQGIPPAEVHRQLSGGQKKLAA